MINVIDLIHRVTYITEATESETTGHMTHVGDWSISGDPMSSLKHATAMHEFMNGQETPGHTVSLKADGGVSLVVGRKLDGRHFITYKSGKKHFHTPEEIEAAGVPWAEDGKRILEYAKKMKIIPGHAFQGDILWADKTKDITNNQIRPNTIRYRPTNQQMGIAVHSQYRVTNDDKLIRTTNSPDIKQLEHKDVFVPNLQIKPGQIRLNPERNKAVAESLSKAKEAMTPEVQSYAKSISDDPSIHKFFQEYLNEVVATTGKRSVDSLREYIHRPIHGATTSYGYMEKSTQRKKSDKAKQSLTKHLESHIDQNKENISKLFEHMQHITTAKHHILDQVKEYRGNLGLDLHGDTEHEGIVSAFGNEENGKFNTSLAKFTREGIRGFSALNRRRGVERGFTKEREVPHQDVPFVDHTDEQYVKESHNIETLKNIPTSRLKKLHKKYSSKSSDEARKEAATIKKIIKSRVDEEMSVGAGGIAGLGGPEDVAVPVAAQKRYTRSGPMRRRKKIAESFLKNLNENLENKNQGEFFRNMFDFSKQGQFANISSRIDNKVTKIGASRFNPNAYPHTMGGFSGTFRNSKISSGQIRIDTPDETQSKFGTSATTKYIDPDSLEIENIPQLDISHPHRTGEINIYPQNIIKRSNTKSFSNITFGTNSTKVGLANVVGHEFGHKLENERAMGARVFGTGENSLAIGRKDINYKYNFLVRDRFKTMTTPGGYVKSGSEAKQRLVGAIAGSAAHVSETGKLPSFQDFLNAAEPRKTNIGVSKKIQRSDIKSARKAYGRIGMELKNNSEIYSQTPRIS